MRQIETRGAANVLDCGIETRGDGKPDVITGYAAVFYDGSPETEFELMPGVVERLHPGAFDQRSKPVVGLFNHSDDNVLGHEHNGTLRLSVDERGLKYEIDINPDDPMAVGVAARVRRGDVAGSSFGFIPTDGGSEWSKEDKLRVRNLRSVETYDVGPVTFAAYAGTSVEMARRSLDAAMTEEARLLAERDRDLVSRFRLAGIR